MARILATSTAFPPHCYAQDVISAELSALWGDGGPSASLIERLHRATNIEQRYLSAPREDYLELSGWERPNELYQSQALELSERVAEEALQRAGVKAGDVRCLIFVSTTGISVPSIDARLMNRMPFDGALKRLPIYGLGCAAGAAGVARAADYLKGHRDEVALLIALELCSLTIQKSDTSIANVIACGLFGDGAAAVVLAGDDTAPAQTAAPRVVDCRSVFFPQTEDYMGWRVRDDGLEILLSAEVPAAAAGLREPVDELLEAHGLGLADISRWICHPGGPKVIEALEEAFELDHDALALSRQALRRIGNISSASVLVILDEVLREHPPEKGEYGLMTALGPGFAAELVLLQW